MELRLVEVAAIIIMPHEQLGVFDVISLDTDQIFTIHGLYQVAAI